MYCTDTVDVSLRKPVCGAPMPIIALMCRAVGVSVMMAREMKCIVGHKKEMSNVGARSFLFSVFVTTGRRSLPGVCSSDVILHV